MDRVANCISRKGHHEVDASDGRRAWRWRYWPASVELLAYSYHFGCLSRQVRELLDLDGRARMAARVEMGKEGLPELEPLASGGDWANKFPKLVSYLVDPLFTDGSPRQPSKLFVAVDKGKWVWCLKEPNQGIMLEVVVEQPEHGPTALEAALNLVRPPWRHDPWARKANAKRAK